MKLFSKKYSRLDLNVNVVQLQSSMCIPIYRSVVRMFASYCLYHTIHRHHTCIAFDDFAPFLETFPIRCGSASSIQCKRLAIVSEYLVAAYAPCEFEFRVIYAHFPVCRSGVGVGEDSHRNKKKNEREKENEFDEKTK